MRQRVVSILRRAVAPAAASPLRSPVRREWARRLRALVVVLVAATLLPVAIHADEAKDGEAKPYLMEGSRITDGVVVAFDLLFMRPVAALATGVGFALFVPAALLSLPEGERARKEAWQHFVITPAERVYGRPLGEF